MEVVKEWPDFLPLHITTTSSEVWWCIQYISQNKIYSHLLSHIFHRQSAGQVAVLGPSTTRHKELSVYTIYITVQHWLISLTSPNIALSTISFRIFQCMFFPCVFFISCFGYLDNKGHNLFPDIGEYLEHLLAWTSNTLWRGNWGYSYHTWMCCPLYKGTSSPWQ